MEESSEYSREDILAIHKDAERLLRKRRIGTSVIYYSLFLAILGSITCMTQLLINKQSGQTWPPSFNSTSWSVFMVSMILLLVPILSVPVGCAILTINRTRIALFTRKYGIENFPSEPEPQLDERFGSHRVVEVTDSTLHVIKARFANATGIIRLFATPVFLAVLVLVIHAVATGGVQGHYVQAFAYIVFCIFALCWTVAPASLQWIVESRDGTPRLSMECIRWFFFRSVTDIAGSELVGFSQHTGTLFIFSTTSGKWPLASVSEDQLGQWKARRLSAAISLRLGITDVDNGNNDELG